MDGDPQALEWLGNFLRNTVRSSLIGVGAQVAEAEEVCESLISLLVMPDGDRPARLAAFDGLSSLETWIYTVALNRLLTRKRKGERWHRLIPLRLLPGVPDEVESGEISGVTAADTLLAREAPLLELMREAIEHAFANCAPEDFVLLQLSHCDGLRGRELARMFGCHSAQISRRLEMAQKAIATSALEHVRQRDPWLDLTWDDFTVLCRTATPACFGVE